MKYLSYYQKMNNELTIRGYTKATIDQYMLYTKEFLEYFETNNIDLENLSKDDVVKYLAYKKTSLKNISLSLIYSILTLFCKEILTNDVMNDIKPPKKEKYLPTVLSKEEIKSLINSSKDKRDKLIIELLYSSGLRVSELCHLKLQNIDVNQKIINIKEGKGNKDRIVIISEKWLNDYVAFAKKFFKKTPKEYVFCKKNGKPLSPDTIQKIVRESAKEARIHKEVTPHVLRHSYATHLLENGENIRKIQTLLGHASLSTTQIYTKVSTDELKKVKSPLDDL